MHADVKNRRGNSARGRKITGMQFLPQDPSQLLITSNDSRVRLYEGEHAVALLPSGRSMLCMPVLLVVLAGLMPGACYAGPHCILQVSLVEVAAGFTYKSFQ